MVGSSKPDAGIEKMAGKRLTARLSILGVISSIKFALPSKTTPIYPRMSTNFDERKRTPISHKIKVRQGFLNLSGLC
jgi:hypothetical protein